MLKNNGYCTLHYLFKSLLPLSRVIPYRAPPSYPFLWKVRSSVDVRCALTQDQEWKGSVTHIPHIGKGLKNQCVVLHRNFSSVSRIECPREGLFFYLSLKEESIWRGTSALPQQCEETRMRNKLIVARSH